MKRSQRMVAYLRRAPSDVRKLFKDPLLLVGILLVNLFLFLFIVLPLFKIFQLSFEENGRFSLGIFWDPRRNDTTFSLIHSRHGVTVSFWHNHRFLFAYGYERTSWKRFFNITATFRSRPAFHDVSFRHPVVW
jgi:iron(III) transport system permease protein